VLFHSFLNSALVAGECFTSHPGPFKSGKEWVTHWMGGRLEPQSRSGRFWRRVSCRFQDSQRISHWEGLKIST